MTKPKTVKPNQSYAWKVYEHISICCSLLLSIHITESAATKAAKRVARKTKSIGTFIQKVLVTEL